MARLPDPILKEITVLEPYEGIEEDRKKFFKCFVELLEEAIAISKEVS